MPKPKPKQIASLRGVDALTREWLRGPADDKAAVAGCRMDVERGEFVKKWIEKYCRLYEGDWAGRPMKLADWQLDCTLRLFGWVRWSEKWKRWIRRFRQASVWIAKKNKKSPTLAAWGLYLLCGDGEPGQKVFLAAKDGTQARDIAGKHTLEMLRQSPALTAECTINLSLMQITHEPSRSILKPLSSSNSRTQESKEGINGSVLIDETHVVDRDFVNRISRAGISRSEPLHIEVSTAGNDPESYGYERFEYAQQVEAGKVDDQQLLAVIHAAPQDLSDADLAADPLTYGRQANPAMGHTVDQEEYLSDYQRSRSNVEHLAEFKMYRLDIWRKAMQPFLRAADWERCRKTYTLDDLAGQVCFAGLDLARVSDMCALVLAFPFTVADRLSVRLMPFFWLPEATIHKAGSPPQYRRWAESGDIQIVPGEEMDFRFIKTKFAELAEKVFIQELLYDPRLASQFAQEIKSDIGVECLAFGQTIGNFAEPTAQFEALVVGGLLEHNGHPVLTWQAGHVAAPKDHNNYRRPMKPKEDDKRKIDGIVSAIMALGGAIMNPMCEPNAEVW